MINVLVILKVKNFEALEQYETFAVAVMKKYKGRLVSAFEIERLPNGCGEEIHLIEFPDEECFLNYKNDKDILNMTVLRCKAISDTIIKKSSKIKSYE